MAKNHIKKHEINDHDDLSFTLQDSYEDETINAMLGNMVGANHSQMEIALELTKLIVDKGALPNLNEEQVLATFQRAFKVIIESSPLQQLWKTKD
jgi:hypothetical protein